RGLSVRELVALGRAPHSRHLGSVDKDAEDVIRDALEACELSSLADRDATELSGGERQRAHLAMAMAQQPRILLLDEPVSALDIHHQLETLELVRRLSRERELTVGVVLHDLNQARRYADDAVVLESGKVVAQGPVLDTITADLASQVFRCIANTVQARDDTDLLVFEVKPSSTVR
ncbi:MAG: ABC transporter ATP-binding protein, partial [Planctomycetota bacterium]